MNAIINKKTEFIDLGLKGYQQAWDYQISLFEKILATKSGNRDLVPEEQNPTANHVIFCEHPHVFTLGKSGDEKNLLVPKNELNTVDASYYHINRGGDITYHGPGQIVGYPILDLENFFTDIHKYMRLLEEALIQTLKEFSVDAGRIPGLTGVWVEHENEKRARKICALGVKTSRWVTMHGFAFNVNSNLKYFDYIVPCGINDKAVTSLQQELGKEQDLNRCENCFKREDCPTIWIELVMMKDIIIPEVKNVTLAVARKKNAGESNDWKVYLLNNNDFPIENTLVASKGYGEKDGEQQRTSILRHFLDTIQANAAVLVEPIDPSVFHLNNEYWVSYYIGNQIFDKRFVFVPDAIREENISFIKELEMEGVLHS